MTVAVPISLCMNSKVVCMLKKTGDPCPIVLLKINFIYKAMKFENSMQFSGTGMCILTANLDLSEWRKKSNHVTTDTKWVLHYYPHCIMTNSAASNWLLIVINEEGSYNY